MLNYFFRIITIFSLLNLASLAWAAETATIEEEKSDYVIQIKYPKSFASKPVEQVIQTYINKQKSEFLKGIGKDKQVPASVTSKNGLYIDYKIPYQNNQALSLLLDVSTYYRGAAHPLGVLVSFNFIDEHQVALEELFLSKKSYLPLIATYCRNQLIRKDLPSKEMIIAGTEPKKENFNTWYFTRDGLAIVFNGYQVAPYYLGAQTIEVPKSIFAQLLNQGISQAVWGTE